MLTAHKRKRADTAILVAAIAAAAENAARQGNAEQARHITSFALAVLPVAPGVERAWAKGHWNAAHDEAAAAELRAVRALAADADTDADDE